MKPDLIRESSWCSMGAGQRPHMAKTSGRISSPRLQRRPLALLAVVVQNTEKDSRRFSRIFGFFSFLYTTKNKRTIQWLNHHKPYTVYTSILLG